MTILVLRSQFFEYLRETLCSRKALERPEAARSEKFKDRLVFVLIYDNLPFYIFVQTSK